MPSSGPRGDQASWHVSARRRRESEGGRRTAMPEGRKVLWTFLGMCVHTRSSCKPSHYLPFFLFFSRGFCSAWWIGPKRRAADQDGCTPEVCHAWNILQTFDGFAKSRTSSNKQGTLTQTVNTNKRVDDDTLCFNALSITTPKFFVWGKDGRSEDLSRETTYLSHAQKNKGFSMHIGHSTMLLLFHASLRCVQMFLPHTPLSPMSEMGKGWLFRQDFQGRFISHQSCLSSLSILPALPR